MSHMLLSETFNKFASEYLAARAEPFESNPTASFFRQQAPQAIRDSLPGLNDSMRIKASVCNGQWTAVPWIGIFDPIITSSALRGHYIVYLFSATMDSVTLSLNQGTTSVREEFKSKARSILATQANILRSRAQGYESRFTDSPINLASKHSLHLDYEAGHAFGKTYQMPLDTTEAELAADLSHMLSLYALINQQGGTDLTSDAEGSEEEEALDWAVEERVFYRLHRRIERNGSASKKAKKALGCVCQGCGFDFGQNYGAVGEGYIEAHHLLPLSELPKQKVSFLDVKTDFAVLCSNCHRMMHRKSGPRTIAELRALREEAQKSATSNCPVSVPGPQ